VRLSTLLFTSCLLMLMFGSLAAAQRGDHTTRIRIPNYVGIKIVDGAGNINRNASVEFNYEDDGTDLVTFMNVIEAGGGTLPPTEVIEFEDIQVATGGAGNWYIYTRSRNPIGFGAASGLRLNDVQVTPNSASSLLRSDRIQIMRNTWNLNHNNWYILAIGLGSTRGWDSLGFNGYDYAMTVQGDEQPGDYRVSVEYLLFTP